MTVTQFDPAAHQPLTELGERLRELAGNAAYRAGRDYLRKGRVQDAVVTETAAYATVKGSSEYRVTVRFPSVEGTNVRCTCPAHRRKAYCKHVVAVCTALVEQPGVFEVTEALPEPPKPKRAPRRSAAQKSSPQELRAVGMEVLDRLLVELADGGLVQLGVDKAALIEQCAELVRALKLRRLGNVLMQLQRVVASPAMLAEQGGDASASFPRLLQELYLCRVTTAAVLDGNVSLDPRLQEDLLGKVWRAQDLEPVTDLELIQVAATHDDDGEFAVDTSYLVDLRSLEIYAERQITPVQLRGASPKTHHRVRLLVEEAGLYPGLPPRRIRLEKVRRAPLRQADVERVVQGAATDLSEIQRRLVEQAQVPFGEPEAAVLFRPAALLAAPASQSDGRGQTERLGAVDAQGRFVELEPRLGTLNEHGRFVSLDWRQASTGDLASTLAGASVALFGLARLGEHGLTLRCPSVVGVTLRRTGGRTGGTFEPGF